MAEYQLENLNALIVSEFDPIRKGLIRVLYKMGFGNVSDAHDGLQASKLIDDVAFDFMILDLQVTKMSGFDLLQKVRNREYASDIPIIVLSADGSREDIVRAADLGTSDYVLKPFQPIEMEKKVTEVLNSYFSPEEFLRLIRLAERLMIQKKYADALPHIDNGLAINEGSVRARHLKAVVLEKLGKTEEAILLLQENKKLNQSFFKTYSVLADIYLKLGKTEQAIENIRNELSLNSKQPKRQIQMAELLAGQSDYEASIIHYREALKEQPRNLSALLGIGVSYAKFGNLDKAIYYFKRVRRIYPNNTKALEAIVKYCLAANEPKKAEMTLRDERAAFPGRIDTYIVLTKFYASTERDEDALATINKGIEKVPEAVDAYNIKAALHMKAKDFDSAIACYQKMLSIKESVEIYLKLGNLFTSLGRFGEGIEVLHRAAFMAEEKADILMLLGEIFYRTKQYTKSLLTLTRAEKIRNLSEKHKKFQEEAKKVILQRHSPQQNKVSA